MAGPDPANPAVKMMSLYKSNLKEVAKVQPARFEIKGEGAFTCVEFLEGAGVTLREEDMSKEPEPGTGRYRILKFMRDMGEPVTAQMISKELDIAYHTVRVLLGRLSDFIEQPIGPDGRPRRGVYVARSVTSSPDQGESPSVAVTSNSAPFPNAGYAAG
jgi:hypothetical protein